MGVRAWVALLAAAGAALSAASEPPPATAGAPDVLQSTGGPPWPRVATLMHVSELGHGQPGRLLLVCSPAQPGSAALFAGVSTASGQLAGHGAILPQENDTAALLEWHSQRIGLAAATWCSGDCCRACDATDRDRHACAVGATRQAGALWSALVHAAVGQADAVVALAVPPVSAFAPGPAGLSPAEVVNGAHCSGMQLTADAADPSATVDELESIAAISTAAALWSGSGKGRLAPDSAGGDHQRMLLETGAGADRLMRDQSAGPAAGARRHRRHHEHAAAAGDAALEADLAPGTPHAAAARRLRHPQRQQHQLEQAVLQPALALEMHSAGRQAEATTAADRQHAAASLAAAAANSATAERKSFYSLVLQLVDADSGATSGVSAESTYKATRMMLRWPTPIEKLRLTAVEATVTNAADAHDCAASSVGVLPIPAGSDLADAGRADDDADEAVDDDDDGLEEDDWFDAVDAAWDVETSLLAASAQRLGIDVSDEMMSVGADGTSSPQQRHHRHPSAGSRLPASLASTAEGVSHDPLQHTAETLLEGIMLELGLHDAISNGGDASSRQGGAAQLHAAPTAEATSGGAQPGEERGSVRSWWRQRAQAKATFMKQAQDSTAGVMGEAAFDNTLDASLASPASPVSPSGKGNALRSQIARSVFGDAADAVLAALDRRASASDGDAVLLETSASTGSRTSSRSKAASAAFLRDAVPLFLETQTNALAKGFPGMDLILKPVMFGAFAPVVSTVFGMFSPTVMDNMQENIQHRMVEQLPADTAQVVTNKGAPALAKGLAEALGESLGMTIGPSLTTSIGPELSDSIPPAVVPQLITQATRIITDTVVGRATMPIAQQVAYTLTRSLGPMLSKAITHTLVSTLSLALHPIHMPPDNPTKMRIRQMHCDVCTEVRMRGKQGLWLAGAPPPFRYSGGQADFDTGSAWHTGESQLSALGQQPAGDSLACYVCEHGSKQERDIDAHVTQQLAHYYADYYAQYMTTYYSKAAAGVKGDGTKPPKK